MGRLWGWVGNTLYYSAGPDCTNGDGNASWPPANYFETPTSGMRLVPYQNGMLYFTQADMYAVKGTCSAIGAQLTGGAVFTCPLWQAGIGIASYNAVDTFGAMTYVFTSDNQLLIINPGSGIIDLGFPVSNNWGSIDPSKVSLAFHRSGYLDQALFICDGAGTVWRCNPSQMPESSPCWSPRAVIVAGAKAIASIAVAPGQKQLWIGSGSNILKRDWSTYQDNGASYSAYAVWGSIVLCQPGQTAEVESITTESKNIGSMLTLSVLPEELSGNFVKLAQSVQDPPDLLPSKTLQSRRFYLAQASIPTVMRHLMMRIDFAAENAANELLGYSIYGAMEGDR